MTSTIKTSVVVDTSALVDGTGADASDVSIPLTQTQTQLRSGQVAVSAADTHVKHLEDAITAGAGITITKNNAAADESLAISTSIEALSPTTTKGDLLVDDGTNLVRLPVGANNQILTADSSTAAGVKWGATTQVDYVRLSYTVPPGTSGGTAAAGGWQVRPINTKDSDTSGICGLSNNQFTLAAGTYDIDAISMFSGNIDQFQTRLYNTTNATVLLPGTVSRNGPDSSFIKGRFVLTASANLQIEYGCLNTAANVGLGYGVQNFVTNNVFLIAELRRLS